MAWYDGMVIYLVEGEKAAEDLERLGLAVASFGKGAWKWDNARAPIFRRLNFVIIADKADSERINIMKTARELYCRTASLKVVELPDREGWMVRGVSDWLAAGGTREELEQLCKEEKEWKPSEKDNMAHLVHFTHLQSEGVEWLWHPYLPKGKLTLLEGDPGVGKSWISLAIAAEVSTGRGMPDAGEGTARRAPTKEAMVDSCLRRNGGQDAGGSRTAPTMEGVKYNDPTATGETPVLPRTEAVLIVSAEDGLVDTIYPRLNALGANMENIHAIEGPLSFDEEGLRICGKFIEDLHPALVIIDPLVAYFGKGVDVNRAKDTRKVLSKLAQIAEKYNASILAVRHLAKGGATRAIYRGLGSIDITAACRSVLLAGCDPENPQKRALAHIKSNLAPLGRSMGYEIWDGSFYWMGESNLTAEQILSKGNSETKTVVDEALEFLKEELAEGAVEVKKIFSDARAAGIESQITLRRAKNKLGVRARRESEAGKSGSGRWLWELPPKPPVAGATTGWTPVIPTGEGTARRAPTMEAKVDSCLRRNGG